MRLYKPARDKELWPFSEVVSKSDNHSLYGWTGVKRQDLDRLINAKRLLCADPTTAGLVRVMLALVTELIELRAVEITLKSLLESREWGDF